MAGRKSNIEALLSRSEHDIIKIENEYNAALSTKSISSELKIDIKNLCENLRSALDYLAHEIREKYCPVSSSNRFYFPVLPDKAQYETRMTAWYPELDKNCPDLWDYLESIQPYNTDQVWLGQFNRLNNQNKHGDLVEQTRTETKEVRVDTKDGGSVRWNPDGVKFGPGVFIGGVPVDPQTQMPVPHPTQLVKHIIWVDFRFEGIDVSALILLKRSISGIRQIFESIKQWVS